MVGHRLFILLLMLIAVIRFMLNYLSPNFLHPDAIMQTLEQAHRLVFGAGMHPWEFVAGVRSWLFPGFLAIFLYLGSFLAPGSYGYTFLIDLVLVSLSLLPILYVYSFCLKKYGSSLALFASLMMGLFHYATFFSGRALSEGVATDVFFAALLLFQLNYFSKSPKLRDFLVGLLLGLCFCLRIQYIFAVFFAFYSFYLRRNKSLFYPVLGFMIIFFAVGFLDMFTWNWPFQSMWLYFKFNGLDGKSANWGVSPWFFYLKEYVDDCGISLLLFFPLACAGLLEAPFLFVVFLSVLIPHSFISHKEFRFIYLSTIAFSALISIGGVSLLKERFSHKNFGYWGLVLCILLAFIKINVSSSSHWLKGRGELQAFRYLSTDTQMTGVGIKKRWWETGGFYYLHRNVPIVRLELPRVLAGDVKGLNRIIAPKDEPPIIDMKEARKIECFHGTCIYDTRL